MESAALSLPLFTISRALNRFPSPLRGSLSATPLAYPFRTRNSSHCHRISCFSPGDLEKPKVWIYTSAAGISLQNSPAATPISGRLACFSSSARVFSSGGSGDGVCGGNGGGSGGGGSGGGETDGEIPIVKSEDVSTLSSDVIILDVTGMTCGGCAASVKRILESQPQVSSASVNLTTETAVVWPVPEVKVTTNWQQQLGEKLAEHLTSCGFTSNLRGGVHTFEENIHKDAQGFS